MADPSVLQDQRYGNVNVHNGDVEKQNTEAGAIRTTTSSSPPISSSPEAKMTGRSCLFFFLYHLGLMAMSVAQIVSGIRDSCPVIISIE